MKTSIEIQDSRALRCLTALAYREFDHLTFKQIGLKMRVGSQRARQLVYAGERQVIYWAGSRFKQAQIRNLIKLIQTLS